MNNMYIAVLCYYFVILEGVVSNNIHINGHNVFVQGMSLDR